MTAVLVALPTARPAVADDSDDRTQLFRPTQKRPTWKDVERARAAQPLPAGAPVVRLVPPPDTRVSSQARKPAPKHVPPYLRPGYVFPDALTGSEKMARDAASCRQGLASIRPCPPSLAKLLATPEWKGSTIQEPSQADREHMAGLCKQAVIQAHEMRGKARGAAKRLATALIEAREARLARVPETVRVVHPSGASILWLAS